MLVPCAWMAVLWFLSSLPSHAEGSLIGHQIPPLIQNGAHVVVYAILAATWFWALGTGGDVRPRIVAALSIGYGVIDEIHQSFVPGRECSLLDLFLDGFGIACVIWFVRTYQRANPARYASNPPVSP